MKSINNTIFLPRLLQQKVVYESLIESTSFKKINKFSVKCFNINYWLIVLVTSLDENADQLERMIRKMMNCAENIHAYTSTAPVPTVGSSIRCKNFLKFCAKLKKKLIMLIFDHSKGSLEIHLTYLADLSKRVVKKIEFIRSTFYYKMTNSTQCTTMMHFKK